VKSSDSSQSGKIGQESEAERFVPDRDGPELAYEHVHRYALAAKVLKGLRVLDLAAGSGYGALLMQEAGCRMTTLDLDPSSLRGSRSGFCADAQKLPLRNDSFDAVVCFEAIEHVKDPEALVREVERVLCDRSIFLVSTPDRSIYSDRAGHQNPYHLAEMTRPEFAALLERHFEHVAISGQGLWAGSWITAIGGDASELGLNRRKVDATRWQGDAKRASAKHARWASPEIDELPVPVYLFATCSNSSKGWNRIKRSLSTDSVLHDPSQWLLANYERLVEENVGRNEALEGQIERARLAQGDLEAQLRVARTTIDEQANLADAARSSMDQLEEEIRNSRKVADRQSAELRRAQSASDDQHRELVLARQGQDDLQSQLTEARRASADHADEIARSRAAIDEKDQALVAAKSSSGLLEGELDRARESIDHQRLELNQAESGAQDMESQIEAARSTQADLQAQVEAARSGHMELATQLEQSREEFAVAQSSIADFETELAAARRGAQDMERQIGNARTLIKDNERELELARRTLGTQKSESAALKERATATQREIERLQTVSATLHARVDDLERAHGRLWARIGHRLSDWVDGLSGSN
jgi:SAM-dependent methyltransferase